MSSEPVAEDAKAGKKRPPETPIQSTPTSASGKKRPYRRTKRPKDYNDKSTVTTTTPTLANRPVNVYDAVLGECEDLLKASIEAQKLGRLKMASAYQLLLHTRLVGLGKRFDRIAMIGATTGTGNQNDGQHDDDDEEEDDGRTYDSEVDNTTSTIMPTPLVGTADVANLEKPAAALDPTLAEASIPATSGDEPLRTPQNLPPALAQLISVLPSDLEMDATMMEKLARTAVELHHQRTGRKKSADGLLASPMMDPMLGNMGDNDGDDDDDEGRTTPTSSNRKGRSDSTKVAWTPDEQQVVEKGVADKKSHYEIAKTLKNKTEAQVKAFIKNQAKSNQQNDTLAEDLSSPGSKKRGGRGKKPPTTAMNTVPNAMLDAKALLQGNVRLGGNR